MEHTGSQHRIGTGPHGRREIPDRTGTAAGDHRNRHRCPHRAQHRQVKARLGAVGIHGIQQNLAHAEFCSAPCPFDGVDSGALPSAVCGDLPPGRCRCATRGHGARVDGQHNALRTELAGEFGKQFGSGNRGGIDRHLVRSRTKERIHIGHRPNTTAHGQRNEYLFGGAAHHIEHGGPARRRGRHVEECQFVGALSVIRRGQFHRITGVAQVGEVDALDHPAGVDVQTRYDPDSQVCGRGQHVNGSPRPMPRGD